MVKLYTKTTSVIRPHWDLHYSDTECWFCNPPSIMTTSVGELALVSSKNGLVLRVLLYVESHSATWLHFWKLEIVLYQLLLMWTDTHSIVWSVFALVCMSYLRSFYFFVEEHIAWVGCILLEMCISRASQNLFLFPQASLICSAYWGNICVKNWYIKKLT